MYTASAIILFSIYVATITRRDTSSSTSTAYDRSSSGTDSTACDEGPSGSEHTVPHIILFRSRSIYRLTRSWQSNSPGAFPATTLPRGTPRSWIRVRQVWEVVSAQPSTLVPLSSVFQRYLSTQYCWRFRTEGAEQTPFLGEHKIRNTGGLQPQSGTI